MSKRDPIISLNPFDFLVLVVKWRILFIVNFCLVVVASVIIALTLPVWYSATTIILPAGGAGGGLPSFLPQDLAGMAAGFGLDIQSEDIYMSILGCRTLKERMIKRFNLKEVYKMKKDAYPEDALEAFESHLALSVRDDNTIAVTIEDRDPKRAMEMADAYASYMDEYYSELSSESARKNRIFIEKRLTQVTDSLAELQDSLMGFQLETGVVSLPEQTVAMITAAAELKAEKLSNDVKLEVVRNSFSNDHPMVFQLRAISEELDGKYNAIVSGREGSLFVGLEDLPLITRKFAELWRQMKIQGTLLEFIHPQYENARIQEERETANVQILDKAQFPNKKSRPTRKFIVLIAAGVSLIVTLLLVAFLEYWRSLPERNSENWGKIQWIVNSLRGR